VIEAILIENRTPPKQIVCPLHLPPPLHRHARKQQNQPNT
jgi:hypothetical protein